jgi:RNA polymerase subunit RPABC4/transcription elongation factor Spt4
MAIVKCKECGNEVSTKASNCPKCGAKVKKPVSWIGYLIAGAVGLAIIKVVVNDNSTSSDKKLDTTKSESIRIDPKEAQFQMDVLKIRALKESVKNPASFELVQALRMTDGTLCVRYRGTNSFNAIVTEQVPILRTAKLGVWNTHCGGKKGEDITEIKAAL